MKLSFFLSTFYNFLGLSLVWRKVSEHFVSLMLSKNKFFNVSVFNLIKLLSIPFDIHILAVCTKFVIRPSLPRVERTSEVLIRRPYWGSTPIASTLSSFSSGIPVSFTENHILKNLDDSILYTVSTQMIPKHHHRSSSIEGVCI